MHVLYKHEKINSSNWTECKVNKDFRKFFSLFWGKQLNKKYNMQMCGSIGLKQQKSIVELVFSELLSQFPEYFQNNSNIRCSFSLCCCCIKHWNLYFINNNNDIFISRYFIKIIESKTTTIRRKKTFWRAIKCILSME